MGRRDAGRFRLRARRDYLGAPPRPQLTSKPCPRCRQVKPVEAFGPVGVPTKRNADGLRTFCLDCEAELREFWRKDLELWRALRCPDAQPELEQVA